MNVLSIVMMVAAAGAMVGGAFVMASGQLGVAGALFLSASILIYVRERWV